MPARSIEQIQCPKCHSSYEVSVASLKSASLLRCGECGHMFPNRYGRAKKEAAPRVRETEEDGAQAPADLLQHATGSDSVKATKLEEEDESERDGNDPRKRGLSPDSSGGDEGRRGSQYTFGIEEEWTLEHDLPGTKKEKRRARETPARRSDEVAKVRAVLVFLALVVAAYAAFAVTMIAQPRKARALFEGIPLVGQGLGGERLDRYRVRITDVTGSIQRLRGKQDALVIVGNVVNGNPVPLREVQIAGLVFDGRGQLIEEKRVFCGTVADVGKLQTLNPQEISALQHTPPTYQEFVLRPGASEKFVMILLHPQAKEAREARLEVVAVRRQV